ncbi:MAG: MurR/RpiR family transcriptional regulator [Rhodobacteraceae bacterium]|jgi:DNA-binding MurR/RpiR family transcriptional regulator|nr:MurR/RpiR family transcriptional regulator [Paracoccaceae bacterium]
MAAMPSIEEKMRQALGSLTRAERQAATHILSHYPVSALGSITALARAAEVSSPTVVRLVQRLGYRGYSDYQAALRDEVEAMLVSPLAKQARRGEGDADAHVLSRFASLAMANIEATVAQIDTAAYDAVAALLADPARRVMALGGRLTHVHADYFATLMKVARPGVSLMSGTSDPWPAAMLDLGAGDVAVLFDVRRYEASVVQAAEQAAEQGAVVVVVTDRWRSPAAAKAQHVLTCHIEVPSAWDSTVPILFLIETLVASVQGRNWGDAESRLKRLEEIYARTRFFRGGSSGGVRPG